MTASARFSMLATVPTPERETVPTNGSVRWLLEHRASFTVDTMAGGMIAWTLAGLPTF